MSTQQARDLVESLHLAGMQETSAKTGLNVELAFREFTQILMEKKAGRTVDPVGATGEKVELTRSVARKKKCCK